MYVQFWSFTLYDYVTRGPVIADQGAADRPVFLSARAVLVKTRISQIARP
jgi:hypothetical protein